MSLASPALAGRFFTIVPPGESFPSPKPYQNIAATKTSRATHFLLNFMLTLGKKQSSFFSLKFFIIFGQGPGFFNTAQISHLLPCGLPGRSLLIICCEYTKGHEVEKISKWTYYSQNELTVRFKSMFASYQSPGFLMFATLYLCEW